MPAAPTEDEDKEGESVAFPPAKDGGGEGVDRGGNAALFGVVTGVEFADEL